MKRKKEEGKEREERKEGRKEVGGREGGKEVGREKGREQGWRKALFIRSEEERGPLSISSEELGRVCLWFPSTEVSRHLELCLVKTFN